jgi:L-ascorbate metabolism protein UlaG (beta-lactamase superfamily)
MKRLIRLVGLALLILGLVVCGIAIWVWNDRPDPRATGIPFATAAPRAIVGSDEARATRPVTATWLGVTTVLFDDGETQLLTDGFFSRPGLLDLVLDRSVAPDVSGIERALADAGITRLAAVMTVHSHYDHAMDSAEVAKRTGALVLGSTSTANLARGAGLPEDRIVDLTDGGERGFGRFTVRFIRSRHVPFAADGSPPMPGTIDEPLRPPAPITAWREGGSFSILIEHPDGRALVQGSAGYVEGALAGLHADVVFLGIGGLTRQDSRYLETYWEEIVARTRAGRVHPIHYDDFTLPYGEIRPFPRAFDDMEVSASRLLELAGRGPRPVRVELLPFGEPVPIFQPADDG